MKTKIKRHYRSAISVLLSVCMLISCMTVGLIATDAAQATGSDEAVGASADEEDAVGTDTAEIGYNWDGGVPWPEHTLTKDEEWEVTFSSSKTIQFYFKKSGTTYKSHSSQQKPYDSTNQNTFKAHSAGDSNLSFTVQAATYGIVYTGQSNEILNFKFYRKKTAYSITKTDDGNGTLTGPDTANKETEVTLTANPNRGYELDRTNSLLNGSTGQFSGTGNELTFTMPGSAVTAKAVFKKIATKYTVTANQVTQGTGTIGLTLKSGSNTVAAGSADNNAAAMLDTYSGEKLIINLSPGAGYKVSSVTITHNGSTTTYNTSPVSRTYTIDSIAGDVTVAASFVEGSDTKNDYTAVKGDTITAGEAAGTVYSGIKATFYDYYTDGEVNSGWYNGIDSVKEGWTGENDWDYKIRNPYTVLNTALSRDASTNSVPYPMYFGVFAWGDPVKYNNPGYTNAQGGTPAYGHKINDSNFLGGNTKALPGLASDSLTGGAISHSNGTPMKMFDKTWLTTSGVDLDSNFIYFAPTRNEKADFNATTPYFYAYFYKSSNTSDNKFVKMSKDDTTGFYRVNVQNGYDKVIICRMNADSGSWDNRLAQTADLNSSACAGKLVKIDDNTSGASTGHAVKYISLTADSAMASFVNSAFPVRKTTKETDGKSAVYYEFDSSPDHYDTIYFDDLDYNNPTSNTPKIQFSTGNSNKAVKPGYQGGDNNDAGFFPFDKTTSHGKGKDLALGMKLEFKFTLGKNESGQDGYILSTDGTTYIPQTFDFSGDDDLWVYVDDNLILDLGGDHRVTEGSINFATKTVTANVDNALTTAQSITRNGPFTLADKKVHTMTIYYMERGMHESNLKFGFSMSPLETDFSTEKELDDSALNKGIGTYNALTNPNGFTDTFDFTNTSYDSDGTTVNEHSKNKAYDYFQWDSTNSKYVHQNGTYSSDGSGKFSLTSDPTKQYADFHNKLKVSDVLKVVETSQKGYHYTTTYEVTDQEYLVEGSPALIKSGKGADTGKFNFKTVLPNADPQTDVTNIRVKFKNVLKTQTLDVTKVIQDNLPTSEKFTIQLGLKMVNGGTETTLNAAGLAYKSSDDDFATVHYLNNGSAEIGANEILRFEGIPEGAKVTITETDKDGFSFVSMAHSETDANNPFTTSSKSATVTLNNYDTVTITNEKLFDLKIAKAMTGDTSEVPAGTYFPIQVWVKQPSGTLTQITNSNYTNYTYDVNTMPTAAGEGNANDVYFNTASNKFMLKPFKDFTIKGFKKNTQFKVVEHTGTVANCSYVNTVVVPSSGSVVEDSTNSLYGYEDITVAESNIDVTITNNMQAKKSFTIKKEMSEGSDAETGSFTIKVETSTDHENWTALNGTEFTSSDSTRGTSGTDTLGTDGTTTIKKDEILTFINQVNANTYVRVTEVVSLLPTDNSYDSIAVTIGESAASVTPVDETVESTHYKGGYFQLTDAANVIITNSKAHRRTVTITKTTTAPHDENAKFRIRIQTSSDNGAHWSDYHNDITTTLGTTTPTATAIPLTADQENTEYEYLIQKAQIFTLSLPEGRTIRVTENTKTGTGDYEVNDYYTYGSTVVKETGDGDGAPERGTVYAPEDSTYKGRVYTIGTKDAQFTITNNPILETVTVVKETDFKFEDGSIFELQAKMKPKYTADTDAIFVNDGLVKELPTSEEKRPSPAPTEGYYYIRKGGSIKFTNVPKGSIFQVQETLNYGYSTVTGKQRFTFDKMVLDNDSTGADQSNGRYFDVNADRTLTVYNKVFKNTLTVTKSFQDGYVAPDSVHEVTITALKNGINSEAYGTEYASNTANDDRLTYTRSTDTADPKTVYYLDDQPIKINGGETLTFTNVYVGSYFTVQETNIGKGFKFNRIDVSGYADGNNREQFPSGVPSGVTIPDKVYNASEKKVIFQTSDTPASVTVVNELPYRYTIKYIYESYSAVTYKDTTDKSPGNRVVGPKRSFTQSGEVTTDDLSSYFVINEESKELSFSSEESRKTFISNHAPFVDDFMLELHWDGKNVTDLKYTPSDKTISLTTTATTLPKRTVHTMFRFPYEVDNNLVPTGGENPNRIAGNGYSQKTVDTEYGNWATTNREYQDESNAKFVTAPLTINNDGTTQYFQYWQITSIADDSSKRDTGVENKRCYYNEFNMTMYQDNYVEPIYAASPSDFNPSVRSYEDTKNGEAKIDFIENSRNQWNVNGAPDESTDNRKSAGDRVYSDFLLTFGYKDYKLQTGTDSSNVKVGFAFERVHELDKDSNDKYVTKKQSEYKSAYGNGEAAGKVAIQQSVKTGTVTGSVLYKQQLGLNQLDNKNQMKYSLNITNKAYDTLAVSENMNYVYRAYSYIKIGNEVVVSDPVYFTIYDMASINLGESDDKGGRS